MVEGLGFRVESLEVKVRGFGFRVRGKSLGFRI